MPKYKKVLNNENSIEIDGKVILSFDTRYKEYLQWKDENPNLEQLLVDNLKQDIKNKELYNNLNIVKIIVNGKKPNTLKDTQKSVEKFLQIISFKIAITTKKIPHLIVSVFQPTSFSLIKLDR